VVAGGIESAVVRVPRWVIQSLPSDPSTPARCLGAYQLGTHAALRGTKRRTEF